MLLCCMHWACGDALHGVETERGWWNTVRGDMGCLLNVLGLQGLLLGYVGPMGSFIFPAKRGIARFDHQLLTYQLASHLHCIPQTLRLTGCIFQHNHLFPFVARWKPASGITEVCNGMGKINHPSRQGEGRTEPQGNG